MRENWIRKDRKSDALDAADTQFDASASLIGFAEEFALKAVSCGNGMNALSTPSYHITWLDLHDDVLRIVGGKVDAADLIDRALP